MNLTIILNFGLTNAIDCIMASPCWDLIPTRNNLEMDTAMEDFSFIQITDHHLLESEEALRDGFCPGHAFRMVMRHISQNIADKVDFIISTGDLVEPETEANYQGAIKLLGINSSGALPGPQHINIEGLKDFPFYFLPGN